MKKGIKRRWVLNYVLILMIVLIFIEIAFVLLDRNYLYDQVVKSMTARIEFIANYYNKYLGQEQNSLLTISEYIVKEFGAKDRFQLTVLNQEGIVLNSTGEFRMENVTMQEDFLKAQKGFLGISEFRTENFEKILSASAPLMFGTDVVGILNLTTVVNDVENKLYEHIKISIIFMTGILFIAFFSSLVFNRTILEPIKEINRVSKKMASGDLAYKIEKRYDDEIGELAENLNRMSEEIEKSQKIKNDFISSISHELRTPLTSIKGWSETLLLTGIQNSDIEKSAQIIRNESERLSKLVDELLDFSKIQSGRFTILPKEIYLEDILIEVVDMMMYRANEKNMEIHYYSSVQKDKIMGDADRLRQVFINIIENAIKFTDKGTPVEVRFEEEETMLRVSIRDDGIGIEQKYLDKIKNNFFKVHPNRQGSGLGLAISEQIISMHHGLLTINSIESAGTTVSIRLPKWRDPI